MPCQVVAHLVDDLGAKCRGRRVRSKGPGQRNDHEYAALIDTGAGCAIMESALNIAVSNSPQPLGTTRQRPTQKLCLLTWRGVEAAIDRHGAMSCASRICSADGSRARQDVGLAIAGRTRSAESAGVPPRLSHHLYWTGCWTPIAIVCCTPAVAPAPQDALPKSQSRTDVHSRPAHHIGWTFPSLTVRGS
jgi:hypothetical protein